MYEIYPLGRMLSMGVTPELLGQRIREFRCSRDEQLVKFIHEQAMFYEFKGYGRTYLVFDVSDKADNEVPPIAAFFTLALTARRPL